jgi:putative tryptophan/tyrosine transport system substrate-binding protein
LTRWTDHPWRLRCASLAAWACTVALSPGRLQGATVVIVMSGEESPYVAARDAASKALIAGGHSVQVIQLRDLSKEAQASLEGTVNVYLAIGTKAATAIHETVKAPALLAYCMVPAPVRLGLAQAAPASGISMDVPTGAQIDLVRKALPKAKVIGLLYHSDVPASLALMKDLEQALPKDLRLLSVPVDKHPSVASAIEALLDRRPDLIWTAADSAVYDTAAIRALLLASVRRQVPVLGFSVPFVKAGALLGTGIDPRTQGEQAAALVTEMLRLPAAGARGASAPPGGATPAPSAASAPSPPPGEANSQPATSHRVLPPKFEIAVNLVVAQRLSIEVPAEVIEKASAVFRPEENKP